MSRRFYAHVRSLVGALLIAALLAVGMGVAPNAYATGSQFDCKGNTTVQFDPGLTYTSQDVNFKAEETLAPCVKDFIIPTDITGHLQAEGSLKRSCVDIFKFQGTFTYNWSNSQSSTVYFNTIQTVAIGDITQTTETGTVTAGFHDGDFVTKVIAFTSSQLNACGTDQGLKEINGTLTFTFSPNI